MEFYVEIEDGVNEVFVLTNNQNNIKPEVINRIDEVVSFSPLKSNDLKYIKKKLNSTM